MSTNDITGDKLISDVPSADYRAGWERIFGNKPKIEKEESEASSKQVVNFEESLAAKVSE